VTSILNSSIERAREGSRGYHSGGVVQDGGDGPVPLSLRSRIEERGQKERRELTAGRNQERKGGWGETHRCGVKEGEASRAAGRAEAGAVVRGGRIRAA
jgi:hypothetical protein